MLRIFQLGRNKISKFLEKKNQINFFFFFFWHTAILSIWFDSLYQQSLVCSVCDFLLAVVFPSTGTLCQILCSHFFLHCKSKQWDSNLQSIISEYTGFLWLDFYDWKKNEINLWFKPLFFFVSVVVCVLVFIDCSLLFLVIERKFPSKP